MKLKCNELDERKYCMQKIYSVKEINKLEVIKERSKE